MTRARDVANLIGSGNYSSTTFTATAGQTAFTISHTQGFIQVFMNGLLLDETVDYTSNGSAVTLTSGAAAGDEIEVVAYNTFSVGDALNQAAADTRYVNATGDTMSGDLIVNSNVGIGTNSPDGRADIAQDQNTTKFTSPHLALTASDTTNTTGFTGISYASSTQTNYGWTAGALRATSGNNSAFIFTQHNNSASGTERMRLDAIGRVTTPNQPCFHVRKTGGHGTTGTIIFNTADVNVGNNYSTSTGNFTAPIAGKYLLYTNILSASGVNVGADLKINGTRYAVTEESWPNTSSTYRSTSITVIASLSANDAVRVENKQGGYYGSSAYTFFGGYLLG